MAYYDAFIAQWATYTGTTEEKLAQINAQQVNGPPTPLIVPSHKIYNLLVIAEASVLTDPDKQKLRDILYLGTVDASPNTSIRAQMMSLFGAGTQTRANLTALAQNYDNPQIDWCYANGYPSFGPAGPGNLHMGDVQAAGVS